ncbi:hypothetical protein PLEOSDRAFT_1111358 [Pleurotus ostreatus PC15]|uniref:Anti-proliferative protein domain-containing protein n=2 Tax=Pleurotus TaxID=5320 RepID=A0A067P3R3_PLEO1|nr:hypothetical protein CCMSSC00406_0000243 [Pleurotus cornucopiae]KDQ30521.1 hypothetical protein PLEOSDRAFT_1111358 [Pleurotus ostreatus PC15]
MSSAAASSSLTIAVAHAVSFLTRPLILAYPATSIIRLQLVLEANLIAAFAPSWVPAQPLRGSGRRCLSLAPTCLPPRPVYNACIAAAIQWFDWISLLGAAEFDLFVDPGCVSIRVAGHSPSQLITIWSDELPSPTAFAPFSPVPAPAPAAVDKKTLAQQLLEQDTEEDDNIFTMIADEVAAPTWMTPILDQFPVPAMLERSASPLSTFSSSSDSDPESLDGSLFHSRCSSRASNSSRSTAATSVSAFSLSLSSKNASPVAAAPASALPAAASKLNANAVPFKQSRRERARQARVYVDTTKKEVTPYDGGKTTVLTGGVMLGGPKASSTSPTTTTTTTASPSPSAQAAAAPAAKAETDRTPRVSHFNFRPRVNAANWRRL